MLPVLVARVSPVLTLVRSGRPFPTVPRMGSTCWSENTGRNHETTRVGLRGSAITVDTITMHDPVGDDVTGQGHGDVKWVRVHYRAQRLKVTI